MVAGGQAMPLRDPFHPPLDTQKSWEGFHGAWPTVMVMALNRNLPPQFAAEPRVRLGSFGAGEGGVATAVWAPPQPTLDIAADLPEQGEYEVLVYDTRHHRRLVAAVEIVSPSNKDRPESRRLFVAKCAALLRKHVSVAIVDVITTRHFNL
jgi:hypothetical protein